MTNQVPETTPGNANCGLYDYTVEVADMTVVAGAALEIGAILTATYTACGVTAQTVDVTLGTAFTPTVTDNLWSSTRLTSTKFTTNNVLDAGKMLKVHLTNTKGLKIMVEVTLAANAGNDGSEATIDHHLAQYAPTVPHDYGLSWWQVEQKSPQRTCSEFSSKLIN